MSVTANQSRLPVGILLLVIFFAAGTLICSAVMLALAFPGGLLEPIWRLRPDARGEFEQFGDWSVVLMAAVGAAYEQWDGKGWKVISDWYTANQSDTEPLVDEVSAKYAADKKIQPRDCSKES